MHQMKPEEYSAGTIVARLKVEEMAEKLNALCA